MDEPSRHPAQLYEDAPHPAQTFLYRVYFAELVDEMVPELRESLIRDLLPVARRIEEAVYQAESTFWFFLPVSASGVATLVSELDVEEEAQEFASAFEKWCDYWHLRDRWLQKAAAATLRWHMRDRWLPKHAPAPVESAVRDHKQLTLFPEAVPAAQWPVIPPPDLPAWNPPLFWPLYEERVLQKLRAYRDEIAERTRVSPLKRERKGESRDRHLRWLVRYHICFENQEEIAAEEDVQRRTVSAGIKAATELLGISRREGRAPKGSSRCRDSARLTQIVLPA